jgi:CheY-like chemotaxis protein
MNIENKKVKNTVILVDDSSIDNFVNTKIITRYQFADEVILFTKSKKALAFMIGLNKVPENEIPGILFLDLDMPEIDGFEFLDAFNILCDID